MSEEQQLRKTSHMITVLGTFMQCNKKARYADPHSILERENEWDWRR